MIKTQSLSKTYKNGFNAVKNLTIQVDKGDIFGFLGPNGAGKTTTIRMLNGLLTPTAGTVFVGGMDIEKKPIQIKKMIGVVPESHGYYYSMTAYEYLSYFNSLYNGKVNNDAYILYLLEKVGLPDKKDVMIGQFSRGMKQRVGIAKALINKPKIIFLDEPTLGLDPKGQKEIQQLILDINKTDGITVFITSHLLKDIEVLCNKVCIVNKGELVEQGSIEELQDKYMSGYSLAVTTSDNVKAKSVLIPIPGIDTVSFEGEEIIVDFKPDLSNDQCNIGKREIVANILDAGIDLTGMSRRTLSMEDIFFAVTDNKSSVTDVQLKGA